MTFIEITGHVNENGELEFQTPVKLPPGDVIITIETVDPESEADNAIWDEKLAHLPATLLEMADKALQDYENGLTEDLTDEDFGDDL